jgi:hypothetical protein
MKRVIPGNYFLTKSMEWATKSFKPLPDLELGDYWYLKKFLVYYNYLFSNRNSLETIEVFEEIKQNFSKFIDGLDNNQKKDAESYFFYRDIRDISNIISWNEFYDASKQPNEKKALYAYKNKARKIYWMYLMGNGGQSGIKKLILHEWIPSGVKYHELEEKIINENIKTNDTIPQILNDVAATLRNIRQICFYYGILYRRDNNNVEEYSLTTVGQMLVESSLNEITIVMEHQKLRMISQPPNAKITGVKDIKDYKYFFVELNPYFKILNSLIINKPMSFKQYQYVVSRNVPVDSDISLMEQHVKKFNRKADNATEDFTKEIKKYIHGTSLIKNVLISHDKKGWHSNIYIEDYYKYIKFYKNVKKKIFSKEISRYKKLLVNNYITGKNTEDYNQLKNWYIYISHFDKSLLYTLLIYNWDNNSKQFSNIIKYLNLDIKFIKESTKLKKNNSSGLLIYKAYNKKFVELIDESTKSNDSTKFNIQSIDSLIRISNLKFDPLESKKRKQINIIKSFYIKEKVRKCDCCGEETFITKGNIPYLEYHHLVPLSQEGTDHILNIFGICPMCHRKFHFCEDLSRKELYKGLNQNDTLVKINKDKFSIFNRYNYLYQNGQINLLGLEFLVDEGVFSNKDLEEIIQNK